MRGVLRTLLMVAAIALVLTPIVALAAGCCTATCLDEGLCGTAPLVGRDGRRLAFRWAAVATPPAVSTPQSGARLTDPPPRQTLPLA